MLRVHLLTQGFKSPNGFAFLMPIIIHRKHLLDVGFQTKFFYDECDELTDCDVLIVESKYLAKMFGKSKEEKHDFFASLRAKNDNLIFADIQDSSGWDSTPMLPAVKLYAKAQLLKDRSKYLEPVYSFRVFLDHFHKKHGVVDTGEYSDPVTNREDLKKLTLLWNSSLADYRWLGPYRSIAYDKLPFRPLLAFPTQSSFTSVRSIRPVDVTCRVGTKYHRKSICFHREQVLNALSSYVQPGKLSRRTYLRELSQNKISVSPFGYGETTLRDFETMISGAMLMKPDMTHTETWPNLYEAGETYVPFSWDLEDLTGKIEQYLSDDNERLRIAEQAQSVYRKHLSNPEAGQVFASHFSSIIQKCIRS